MSMNNKKRLDNFLYKVDYIEKNHPDIYKEMRKEPISSDEFNKIWEKIKGEKNEDLVR